MSASLSGVQVASAVDHRKGEKAQGGLCTNYSRSNCVTKLYARFGGTRGGP